MKKAKPIMIQGTMSSAGKSLITAGLCRVFMKDGYQVVPFKSQNMALNSFVTADNKEMGRAQVLQAQACGKEPDVRMNPILLKPTNDVGSQVIVKGEAIGTMSAAKYFSFKHKLKGDITAAFDSLALENDIIVIEGAGSPAEINLKSEDIVNMGMAEMADSPVILVGDIDRGGVFASLYGTVELLEPHERARIKGVIINKFRGDKNILKPGLDMIEQKLGIPIIGVMPYIKLDLDDEDSLSERFLQTPDAAKPIDIAVIRLPRISNFTDFNALSRHPMAAVRYVSSLIELGNPDMVIIPGSKNTMGDLKWMRQNGIEASVKKLAASGRIVCGICGGYQMLGKTLSDPDNTEEGGEMRGMGLLPTDTVFKPQKVLRRTGGKTLKLGTALSFLSDKSFEGYEIHMGDTVLDEGERAFAHISGGTDGAVRDSVFGCYVHGLFDGELGNAVVDMLLAQKGIQASEMLISAQEHQQRQFDVLEKAIRENIDIDAVYGIMGVK